MDIMKAALIFNPHSGRAKAFGLTSRNLLELLSAHGLNAQELNTLEYDGVGCAVNSLEMDSVCIVAGGDGSLYNALQGEACDRIVFGILPLGTANNLANAAGIPMDLESAIKVIASGVEKRIDLGLAGGKLFTQAAGAGFHAQAFHAYGHHRNHSLRDAVKAFFTTLKNWHPQRLLIRVDDESHIEDALQVTVANTPVYGRRLSIAPDAKIDDGLLDVIVIKGPMSKLEIVKCLIKLMDGMPLDPSNVMHVTAKRVHIESFLEEDIPVHADAEPIGYAPVTIEVLSSCLRLLVPKLT